MGRENGMRAMSKMAPILYEGVYRPERRHFLSGSERCPYLQLFPEGIPAARTQDKWIALLVIHHIWS
jgi:hypothetical protein